MLTFREDIHQYRWNGTVVPSVTQLLDGLRLYAGVSEEVMEEARRRGTYVHTACQFFDEEDLDVEALKENDPTTWAYLQGWVKFVRDCEPNWTWIESPFYSQAFQFAGTPDRIGELTYKGKRVENAIVDIKSSLSSHWAWGMQTAAYAHLFDPQAHFTRKRFTVQLLPEPEGEYRLLEWSDPTDWPAFLALVTLRNKGLRHAAGTTTSR